MKSSARSLDWQTDDVLHTCIIALPLQLLELFVASLVSSSELHGSRLD